MTNASLLSPHLTEANADSLLEQAQGKSKGEMEKLIVSVYPRPEPKESLRLLPEPKTATLSFASEAPPAIPPPNVPPAKPRKESIQPLSPRRTKLEFCKRYGLPLI